MQSNNSVDRLKCGRNISNSHMTDRESNRYWSSQMSHFSHAHDTIIWSHYDALYNRLWLHHTSEWVMELMYMNVFLIVIYKLIMLCKKYNYICVLWRQTVYAFICGVYFLHCQNYTNEHKSSSPLHRLYSIYILYILLSARTIQWQNSLHRSLGYIEIREVATGTQIFEDKIVRTCLTHCGLVTQYGDMDLGQHWIR